MTTNPRESGAPPGRPPGGGAPRGPRWAAIPLGRIAELLASAVGAGDAVAGVLRELLEATDTDGGAVILRDEGGYTVAVAETRRGEPLPGAAGLLSHTLVDEVLRTGRSVCVGDAAEHERYSEAASVVTLRLRSVACVPMRVGAQVAGAIFLGKRGISQELDDDVVMALETVGAMLVPLLAQLRRAAEIEARAVEAEEMLVGDCAAMDDVRRLIARVAASDLSVLIQGATGSGKERVARALHAGSAHAGAALVALNCAAVPEGLLAAELFGVKRGAFTGAVADRKGKLEQADGTTLFLDEVGDMPLAMQAALLRALEERAVTRLGEEAARPARFRLVAATHRDLDAAVRAGTFREDLLFRLREVTVRLPPLAERGDDVLLLARVFAREAERQFGTGVRTLSPATATALRAHPWPGNVRELRATMRRAVVLAEGQEIRPEHLQLASVAGAAPRGGAPPQAPAVDRTLDAAREEFVTRYVRAAIERHGGNREAAAAALGISLRSLYRYVAGDGDAR